MGFYEPLQYTYEEKIERFDQLWEFCQILKEDIGLVKYLYPEIWQWFTEDLHQHDIPISPDDQGFREALAKLINGFLEK